MTLDAAVEQIRVGMDGLTWTEKAYGRAVERKVARRDDTTRTTADHYNAQTRNRISREPFVYIGNGEYVSMLPNDRLKAYCFCVSNGEERYDSKQRKGVPMLTRRPFSLIAWVNLKELGETSISVESLKSDALAVLQSLGCVDSIESSVDERSDQVFDGFDLDETKREVLAYPFGGFRINFTLKYTQPC